jgi:hypothetical protein
VKRLAAALLALYRREPARVNGAVASVVSVLLVRVGLDIHDADVLAAVAFVVPLLAAEATRRLVTPTVKVKAPHVIAPIKVPADEIARLVIEQLEGADWSPKSPNARKPKA